jgi:hypothetical protein
VGCYVISTHTTHFVECGLVIETHWDQHGGGMGGYIWIQQEKNLMNASTPLVQQPCG